MNGKARRHHVGRLAGMALISTGGLAACGSSSSGHAASGTTVAPEASTSGPTNFGPVVSAKFAYFVSQNTAVGEGATKFASLVAQDTGNTVKITTYPSSELGSVPSVLQAVEGGQIQFAATTNLSALVPAADAILAPYIFSTTTQAQKALNSPALQTGLWDQFKAKNTQILGVWSQGFADLLTVKPITSPSDMKGLRIRIYDPGVGVPQYKALGADAVNMTPSQVFTALSTHAIDGVEDPPATLYGLKWYQSAKYLTLTQHAYVSAPIVASSSFMNSLTAAQRTGLEKAFTDTMAYEVAQAGQEDSQAMTELKSAGVQVATVSRTAWKSALSPLYATFKAKFPTVWAALAQAGADTSGA